MNKSNLLASVMAALALWGCAVDDGVNEDTECGDRCDNTTGPNQYPFVLVHGFNASPGSRFAFHTQLAPALNDYGYPTHVVELPAYDSIENRAAALAKQVDEILSKASEAKVHLIAHSMGGLDSRYLISKLGYDDRIATLSTLGTPHRGSPAADIYLDYVSSSFDDEVVSLMENLMSVNEQVDPNFSGVMNALSTRYLKKFNEDIEDSPSVYYQSWAGFSSVSGDVWLDSTQSELFDLCGVDGAYTRQDQEDLKGHGMSSWLWGLEPIVGLGDGLVEIESAKWGNFRGCIPADHLAMVGYDSDEPTDFDYEKFYIDMAYSLRRP